MSDLILKQETLDKFMNENFSLEGEAGYNLSQKNKPAYMHKVNNFQEFMVNLDRKNW